MRAWTVDTEYTAIRSAASRTDLTIFRDFLKNMATYLHLPVYKASYDLLLEMFRVIKDFNREYKYTLGENIKREAIEMVTNIYRANSSFSKKPYLQNRIKGNFYQKIQYWNNFLIEKQSKLIKGDIKQFLSSMNSYLGIMKHYNTYKLRKKMLTQNLSSYFWDYVYTSTDYDKLTSKI